MEKDSTRDASDNASRADMSGSSLLLLSLMSALFYLGLSVFIFSLFREEHIGAAFEGGFSLPAQAATGVIAGGIAAALIMFISAREPVAGVLNDFYIFRVISKMRLSVFDRTQLSAFAGAGEELLFRGAIQPLLGNAMTSLIFVGIHGYFKFKSLGHFVFGSMMFGLSLLLGFLYAEMGLVAAMVAHAVYDILMLWRVSRNQK